METQKAWTHANPSRVAQAGGAPPNTEAPYQERGHAPAHLQGHSGGSSGSLGPQGSTEEGTFYLLVLSFQHT